MPKWIIVLTLAACGAPATPAEKKAAAEGTYTAELVACVDKSPSRAAADACAEEVRRRWATLDGGAEAGR